MVVGMDVRERQKERRRIARVGDRRVYYWIKAIVDGRLFVDGPYGDSRQCEQSGYNLVGGNFECVPLETRDSRLATNCLKHRYLEDTKDIRRSTRNARHIIRERNA